MRKLSLFCMALMLCVLGVQKTQAQSVINMVYPAGGEIFHYGDTLDVIYTTDSTIAASSRIQFGLRDLRFSPSLGSGEASMCGDTTNIHHFRWVVPATLNALSEGVLGGDSTYAVVVYVIPGGFDSFAQSLPFSIIPMIPTDTMMHPHFAVSDTMLCHSDIVHLTYDGNCADSPNTVISWNFYGGYSATYTPDTTMGRNVNLRVSPIAWLGACDIYITVRITDTISGGWREFQRTIKVDTINAEIVALNISGYVSSMADSIRVCASDSVQIHVGTFEATYMPVFSWNGGLSLNYFNLPSSARYGRNVVTITSGYGCAASDSMYVILDTTCSGAHSVFHTRIALVDDTICQASYGYFTDLTTSEPLSHASYRWDLSSLVATSARYYDYPSTGFGERFITAGSDWIRLKIYDSLTGISSTDSAWITVLPTPHITSVTGETALGCDGTVLLGASADLSSTGAWMYWAYHTETMDTAVYADTIVASISQWYMVITNNALGCGDMAVFRVNPSSCTHADIAVSSDTICDNTVLRLYNRTIPVHPGHVSYAWGYDTTVTPVVFGTDSVFISCASYTGLRTFMLFVYDSIDGNTTVDTARVMVHPSIWSSTLIGYGEHIRCNDSVMVGVNLWSGSAGLPITALSWSMWDSTSHALSDTGLVIAAYAAGTYSIHLETLHGCISNYGIFVDTLIPTYDTGVTSVHTFYGFDSTLASAISFALHDSDLYSTFRVHSYDTGTARIWDKDSVGQTVTTIVVRNSCDSSIVSSSLITSYDTSAPWHVFDSTHHRWNDTVSCLVSIHYFTGRDSFSTSSMGSSVTPHFDTTHITGGIRVNMDTTIIRFHATDSTRITNYWTATYNFCTGDTTSPAIDSIGLHTMPTHLWSDTSLHVGPIIFCSSDTVHHLVRVPAGIDSNVLSSTSYLIDDTTHSSGGIFSMIVRHNHGTRNVHRNDSTFTDSMNFYIRSLCTGDTTGHYVHGYADTVFGTSYIDSIPSYTYDTTFCIHDSSWTWTDSLHNDTISITHSYPIVHDTTGAIVTTDSMIVTSYSVVPRHYVDTTLWVINRCTGDTLIDSVVGHSTVHDPIYYTSDTVHSYSTDTLEDSGVSNPPKYHSISLYPNPTTDYVVVSVTEECSIVMYDIAGRMIPIITEKIKEGIKIHFENIASGTYMVCVSTQTGILFNGKLIKQ